VNVKTDGTNTYHCAIKRNCDRAVHTYLHTLCKHSCVRTSQVGHQSEALNISRRRRRRHRHHHHHRQNSHFWAMALLRKFCQICLLLIVFPVSFHPGFIITVHSSSHLSLGFLLCFQCEEGFIYRMFQEERSVFWEVILSVTLSKETVYMCMCPIPNGFRGGAISLYSSKTVDITYCF
jgi:hypothetical protein